MIYIICNYYKIIYFLYKLYIYNLKVSTLKFRVKFCLKSYLNSWSGLACVLFSFLH